MRDRKIIKILTLFNLKERKSFLRYVSSPYFNTNQRLVDLLEYIYKFAPDFTNDKLSIKHAFHHVFKKDPFNERIITRLISKLFKLMEDFIILNKGNQNAIKQQLLLLDYYFEHQQGTFFESGYKKIIDQNNAGLIRDAGYFQNQYEVEILNIKQLVRVDKREHPIDFKSAIRVLDIQYWIKKLYLLCSQVNHQRIVKNDKYNGAEVDYVLKFLNGHSLLEVPTIKVWYGSLKLLHTTNIENYTSLKSLLSENYQYFDPNEVEKFYSVLINCVVTLFSRGKPSLEEYFNLFSDQIEKGFIYYNGYILPQVLKNVITVALRLNKYEWAESFLKSNKEKIHSNEVYSWNLSALLYEKGDWEQALDLLTETKYDDIFYQLSTKRLLIKIYYKLGYEELLHSFINTFRVFISRKVLTGTDKETNQQFLNFALKLIKLRSDDREAAENLLNKLEQTYKVADKNWIVGELKELIK